ncbi:ankyrin repeat protein [Colletotrichum sojae]|uniref:Ankyrin repeat protein n=1 Tax=Colletotrichum sojae TaxID=2175907 RepID=A0A8H6MNG1_9PEZI|nr:ankyrin repeat protein [Colletotrichum sojae]
MASAAAQQPRLRTSFNNQSTRAWDGVFARSKHLQALKSLLTPEVDPSERNRATRGDRPATQRRAKLFRRAKQSVPSRVTKNEREGASLATQESQHTTSPSRGRNGHSVAADKPAPVLDYTVTVALPTQPAIAELSVASESRGVDPTLNSKSDLLQAKIVKKGLLLVKKEVKNIEIQQVRKFQHSDELLFRTAQNDILDSFNQADSPLPDKFLKIERRLGTGDDVSYETAFWKDIPSVDGQFRGQQRGDSGSWVIDPSSGTIFGHVIAGTHDAAYVLPLETVMAEAGGCFLPSPFECFADLANAHKDLDLDLAERYASHAMTEDVLESSPSTPLANIIREHKGRSFTAGQSFSDLDPMAVFRYIIIGGGASVLLSPGVVDWLTTELTPFSYLHTDDISRMLSDLEYSESTAEHWADLFDRRHESTGPLWIHLPANNVQAVLAELGFDQPDSRKSGPLIERGGDKWKYMLPLCVEVPPHPQTLRHGVVLTMPFLSFESPYKMKRMLSYIDSVLQRSGRGGYASSQLGSKSQADPFLEPPNFGRDYSAPLTPRKALGRVFLDAGELYNEMDLHGDKSLVRRYLRSDRPLHPRRTLRQAYSSHKEGGRDSTFVVKRAGMKSVVVDQLWIVIVGTKTVVTLFPKPYGHSYDNAESLSRCIGERLEEASAESIPSVYEIATIVLDECMAWFLRRASVRARPEGFAGAWDSGDKQAHFGIISATSLTRLGLVTPPVDITQPLLNAP